MIRRLRVIPKMQPIESGFLGGKEYKTPSMLENFVAIGFVHAEERFSELMRMN